MNDDPEEKLAEHDAGIEASSQRAKEELDALSEDFERRAEDLHDRAADAADRYRARQRIETHRRTSDGEAARGIGTGLSVAYTILGFPLVGFGVGWLIDRYVRHGGNSWQSALGLIGAGAGVWIAIVMVNQQNKS